MINLQNYYSIIIHDAWSVFSPRNSDLVSPESLSNPRIFQLRLLSGCQILKNASVCNHGSIVDRVPFVDSSHLPLTFLDHGLNHLLQSLVTAYSAHNYHLFGPAVAHRSFSHLHQHRKDSFLKWKTKVCQGEPLWQFLSQFLPAQPFVFLPLSTLHLLLVNLPHARRLRQFQMR